MYSGLWEIVDIRETGACDARSMILRLSYSWNSSRMKSPGLDHTEANYSRTAISTAGVGNQTIKEMYIC